MLSYITRISRFNGMRFYIPVLSTHKVYSIFYDDECEEAFDIKDWDVSLVEIEQEMRDVIITNEELFMVSGELQLKKGYEIGCRYWTQHGRPITVKQMINASTKYPK